MKTVLSVLLTGILSSFTANAATIYSQDFNSTSFQNALLVSGSSSDNFTDPTDYYSLNNYDGWTFSGDAYYATNGSGLGAILLNETGAPNATASRTITGLIAGDQYVLQFNVSGDNQPGLLYGLNVTLDGSSVLAYSATDQVQGYYNNLGGPLQSISFTATGTSEVLSFAQTSGTAASPIIDDVLVSSVPEPDSYAMLLAGLGLMGFIAHRRKSS